MSMFDANDYTWLVISAAPRFSRLCVNQLKSRAIHQIDAGRGGKL